MNEENLTNKSQSGLKRKRKRAINTTKERYEIYVSTMKQDYILRSGTVNPTVEENYIKKKWEDLVLKLNSIGNGPCLSIEDWKKRFSDWKNTTRAKFRKIKDSLNRTGGGEAAKIQLTDLEERGLSIWGKITVTGSNLVEESGGLQHINANTNIETPDKIAKLSNTFAMFPCSIENAITTTTTPIEVAATSAILPEEMIDNIPEDIIIDITDVINNKSNERSTNKSVKKKNTSQESSKERQLKRNSKNFNEIASSLLKVYEQQMLLNTNLHENVEYFCKKYMLKIKKKKLK